ncbi:hemerythrin family protein [Halioxenophilus sp. WMMB6]|uniref:bacteriohemerythrin n=1 Tax=Halioxenophilus sp. WMMB6 TaxID=3073815 RepID=UPI00295E27B5|nr:hemerythrin family protein [Halioxenophilus sp. WMMB6]
MSAQDFLTRFEQEYCLGVDTMDETHRQFLNQVAAACAADKAGFAGAMQQLFNHTQAHFADEEASMSRIGHAAMAEHVADHQRILGDMDRFNERVAAGRHTMARAWVADSLLQWFHTHAQTMDSALAAELKAEQG